jgi:hypothetical protein
MKVEFEVTQRRVVLLVIAGFLVLFVLHAACPSRFEFLLKFRPTGSADLAAWVQAIGAIIALAVAIYLPSRVQHEAKKRALDDADLTIRFHTNLLKTNEGLLKGALEHLPKNGAGGRPDAANEVFGAIDALQAMQFPEIKSISIINPDLARLLADFHHTLEALRGVTQRNLPIQNESERLKHLAKTLDSKLHELQTLAVKIRENTVM